MTQTTQSLILKKNFDVNLRSWINFNGTFNTIKKRYISKIFLWCTPLRNMNRIAFRNATCKLFIKQHSREAIEEGAG